MLSLTPRPTIHAGQEALGDTKGAARAVVARRAMVRATGDCIMVCCSTSRSWDGDQVSWKVR